jgi:hypothetical protein
MGDTADLMLDGHLCEHCGVFLNTHGVDGFPQLCRDCAKEICRAGGSVRKAGNGNWQDTTPISEAARRAAKKQPVKCEMCQRSKP